MTILDSETIRSHSNTFDMGRLGFVRVRTEDSRTPEQPSVNEYIVFLPLAEVDQQPGRLRREAEHTVPISARGVYSDAGILNWSGNYIDISGQPRRIMDVPVPSDKPSTDLPAERAKTVALVKRIVGKEFRVTGSVHPLK